jgi:hypothetical protein
MQGTLESSDVRAHYPQFARVSVPEFSQAKTAWCGTVLPFDAASNVVSIYSDLKRDRIVNVQAGGLRHIGALGPTDQDPNVRYLIDMQIEFRLMVLDYANGRHPDAYCVKPEISRQRFPLHPHLRDDLSIPVGGRYIQALCTDYAPDLLCTSIVDLLDYAAIFLAKHVIWLRTRRLIDRAQGRVIAVPGVGQEILDIEGPHRGPEYNAQSAPLRNSFPYPLQERYGWDGFWPGGVAPHDPAANLRLPDNSTCCCGSGRQYSRCHKQFDMDGQRRLVEAVYRLFGAKDAER